MNRQYKARARRRPVVGDESLIGASHYDYADCFEIQLRQSDGRSPEQLFRAALAQAAPWIRVLVPLVHRHVLGLRLGATTSRAHLLGWPITVSEPDVVKLEATGALMRGVIIGRLIDETTVVFSTYMFYRRTPRIRIVWALTSPLHHRVAPYLMERAAASSRTAHRTSAS